MYEKLPYYMAYPLLFSCDDDRAERMDSEYLKSLYPDMPKRILPYVEEECDRMEYENSMVYDQCPDKLQLRLMCRRVYDNVRKHERMFFGDEEDAGLSGLDGDQETGISGTAREREHGRDGRSKSPSLRDFIEVMLYQELYKRRCDHRRRCRRFY